MTSPLIEPAELIELMRTGRPHLALADVRWQLGGPHQYETYLDEHLPGAHFVDLDTELAGPPGIGGRHPLPDPSAVQAIVQRLGVDADSLVVAYDAATALSAARLWWLLTDAGVRCRVLNGGLAVWRAAAGPTASGPVADAAGTAVATPGQRTQVSAEDIRDGLGDRALVDVRAPERFRGEHEPMDPVAGHVPGALNRPGTGNHQADGRFLPAEQLAERFADLAEPVFSCGSGITAAQSLLALESTGRSGSIYPGSWSDWITDPTRPVATGG